LVEIIIIIAVVWFFYNRSSEKTKADEAQRRMAKRRQSQGSQLPAKADNPHQTTPRPASVTLSSLGLSSWSQSSDGFDPSIQVLHFTQVTNLEGISRRGLLLRSQLSRAKDAQHSVNDHTRIDERVFAGGGLCLSLGHPNAQLLFRFSQAESGREYIILELDPHILKARENYLVCPTNAASNEVWELQKTAPNSLKAKGSIPELFARKIVRSGTEIYLRPANLPTWYTTDPQAELLYLQNIPRSRITRIYCPGVLTRQKVEEFVSSSNWNVDVEVDAPLFRTRSDSSEWKNSRSDPHDFRDRVEKHRG